MKILRKLFSWSNGAEQGTPDTTAGYEMNHAGGADVDHYYSIMLETRPGVIAMREAAADSIRSL